MEAKLLKNGTFIPRATIDEVIGDDLGFCIACGAEAYGDSYLWASGCESCGAREVYGLEELLVMGLLELY